MEYKILTPRDSLYPRRLKERLGMSAPEKIYYLGPLSLLKRFTMAVISADSISGMALMETNQVLFTIREYDMNYIGGWHSVMETEILRLGLYWNHITVTLFTAKGLEKENFETFVHIRWHPPMDRFPEKGEYFRRAREGELLMLSIAEPEHGRMDRKEVVERNWVLCNMADVVFVPFAEKGTKTLALAKRVLNAGIPIFTTEHELNESLHKMGVPPYNRKNVSPFLDGMGTVKITDKLERSSAVYSDDYSLSKKTKQTLPPKPTHKQLELKIS